MWFASLKPEDVDGVVKLIVAFVGAIVSIVIAVGGGIASIRAVWNGRRKKTRSALESRVANEVVQGMPITVDQMEFEDTVRTRKRLERAIALLSKNNIEYEDYLDGKGLSDERKSEL